MGKSLLLVPLLIVTLLLVACSAPACEDVTIALALMHKEGTVVSRQASARDWQVAEVSTPAPLFEVLRLTIGTAEYVCDDLLAVYNPSTKKGVVLSQYARELLGEMWHELKTKTFAPALPWTEAQKILARMDIATVQDFETGLRFQVQRRGGTYHADVQPLSRADTAVMKQIYGGVWSWDRRAVIVTVDDISIAASMNGMPHGQGALTNGFPGHFCLHFLGSITHASRSQDLGHHLMIKKAAAEIWGVARVATPEEQVRNIASALNQKDWWLMRVFALPITTAELEHMAANVETWEIDTAVLDSAAAEQCLVRISGEIIYRGGARTELNGTVKLKLEEGIWRIDAGSLKDIF